MNTEYKLEGLSLPGDDLDLPMFLEQTKGGGFITIKIPRSGGRNVITMGLRRYNQDDWTLRILTVKERGEKVTSNDEKLKGQKALARINRLTTSASLGKVSWKLWGSNFEPIPDHQCLVNLLEENGWTLQKSGEVAGSSRRYVRRPELKSGRSAVINGPILSSYSNINSMGHGQFTYLDLWKHFNQIA